MKEINHDFNHDLTFYCTPNQLCVPQYKAETSSLCIRSMFRVLGIYNFGHVVHGKKINAILTCKYVCKCLFEHEKGFSRLF